MGRNYNPSCINVNKKTCRAENYQSCNLPGMFRGDRLAALIEERGFSQSSLARKVGISQTAIWKLVREPSQGSKHTHRIAEFLGTSAQYLMGETDDPAPKGGPEPETAFGVDRYSDDPDIVEIPMLDLRYGMGGTFLDGPIAEERRPFPRSWLRAVAGVHPDTLFWALGSGSSMEPTIRSGEMLLIDRSDRVPLSGDDIWAFAWGEIGMVKRLRPRPDGTVEIHSDNPHVPMTTATGDEIHTIGRVVAVVRRL